jgi:hypothetical protein
MSDLKAKFLYTTVDSVKVRLAGKVQFQEDCNSLQNGELPDLLLLQLIRDAETETEQDLRSRYSVPFRSIRTGQYCDLPDHSQRALRKVVDLKAVQYILDTDFGRGTHISGKTYSEVAEDAYKVSVKKLLGMDMQGEESKRFKFSPPLEDLMLAYSNSKADDGIRGTIINTDASIDSASYAAEQINDPSQSYLRRRGGGLL